MNWLKVSHHTTAVLNEATSTDSGTGTIRTASGRELDFDVEHSIVLGSLVAGPRVFAISTGQAIGYDVLLAEEFGKC